MINSTDQVDPRQYTVKPYELLQKLIRDTSVAFPQELVLILDRVVKFDFRICEPTPGE